MDEVALQQLFLSTRHEPVRVEGRLRAIHANRHFTVVRDDGACVHGLLQDSVSAEYLARFLNQPISVFGWGVLLPGGELLFVFAHGVLPTLEISTKSTGLSGQAPEARAEMANRLKQAIGAWPGDESDEQIKKELEELS